MQDNKTTSANQTEQQNEQSIDIKAIFYLCLSNWYWFLISVVVALVIATFYLHKTTPVYTRSAKLLVKSDERGMSSYYEVSDFSDMGLFSQRVKINNEMLSIKTLDNLEEAVQRLNLNVEYSVDGRLHPILLYDRTLPVTVNMLNMPDNATASFDIAIGNNKITLSDFVFGGEKMAGTVTTKFGDNVNTPIGLLCVQPTDYFVKDVNYDVIHVRRYGIENTARRFGSRLGIGLADKNADVVALSIQDISKKRGDDFLNTIIAVYNDNWLKDKNQIMVSTSMFIDERLSLIEQELGNVDSDISSYKSENLLPDVKAVSNIYLSQNTATTNRILEINNQISITNFIKEMLAGELSKNQLLPANSGINNNIESQISNYNTMMLRRNSLVANSSEENPLVLDLDKNLESMRQAIMSSIDNQLVTLNDQLNSLQGTKYKIDKQLAANPSQAKYLLTVERQQKVKESLYLFLLQKREENQLSQAFTAYNTRVIEQPNGSVVPTKPRASMIRLIAIILGLALPGIVLFLREQLNTTIRSRKDLEKLSLPFVGEIPLAYSRAEQKKRKKEAKKKKGKGQQEEEEIKEGFARSVMVKKDSRNVINEAFRVFRTNLEFMAKDNASNVFMYTSFNPGSGKSFIAINSAIALAIKEKKVLVIDGDLRHASLSTYIFTPKQGLADYLARQVDSIDKVIIQSKEYPTLSYLPVGTTPPNPTELLEDNRFGELITRFGKEYDYVLIDCPPIDIVADPQIINKYVDRTIFVVRAGLMERSLLPELESIYLQHKYKNMCLILNGTTSSDGRYGYNYRYGGYGYRYGYHYGYGYHSKNAYGANGYYHEDDKDDKEE